jgi:hypothetical protein
MQLRAVNPFPFLHVTVYATSNTAAFTAQGCQSSPSLTRSRAVGHSSAALAINDVRTQIPPVSSDLSEALYFKEFANAM